MAFIEITGKELHRLDAYMVRHNGRLPSAYRVQPAPKASPASPPGTDRLTLSHFGAARSALPTTPLPVADADAPATRLADLARLGRDFDAPVALAVPLRRAVALTMLELGGRQADLNARLDALYQTLDAVAEGALILSADDLAGRLKAVLSDVADTRPGCTPTQAAALDRLVAAIADEARRATTKRVVYKQLPPCEVVAPAAVAPAVLTPAVVAPWQFSPAVAAASAGAPLVATAPALPTGGQGWTFFGGISNGLKAGFDTVCVWGVAVGQETARRVSRAAAALAGWD